MAAKRIEEISNSITEASQLQGNELFIVSAEDENAENETGYSTKKMDIQTIRDYVRRESSGGTSSNGLTMEQVLNQIYPVGSIYLDGNGNSTCPLATVISGSEWVSLGTKLLTGGSKVPVVGNGKALIISTGGTATRGCFINSGGNI